MSDGVGDDQRQLDTVSRFALSKQTLCSGQGPPRRQIDTAKKKSTMGALKPDTLVQSSSRPRRVVLYSHDTFGLGHLRRSRALASALTQSGTDIWNTSDDPAIFRG